ncbi:MAG: hypothetical protein ACE5IK_04195 [Acidobacteriota bacterium]
MQDRERARTRVIANLLEVRRRIAAEDEPAVLELLNQEDAFCEVAHERQDQAPVDRQDEVQCHFCEGYLQAGGCAPLLTEVNHAVFAGDWGRAREVIDRCLETVRSLDLASESEA